MPVAQTQFSEVFDFAECSPSCYTDYRFLQSSYKFVVVTVCGSGSLSNATAVVVLSNADVLFGGDRVQQWQVHEKTPALSSHRYYYQQMADKSL